MSKTWKRVVLGLGIVILVLVGGALGAVELRWKRTFDTPYPAISASSDPAIVERGRYLVFGAAACAYCHLPRDRWTEMAGGAQPPLTGNHLFRLPVGDLYSANITPDPETGIGRRSDGELARLIRHGVRADGRAAFPLMAFGNLSDEDLTAVISFLKSRAPERLAVNQQRLGLLGKALMAFAIEPDGSGRPPAASPAGPSAARGEYLANSVSSCVECHTNRGGNGEFVGARFAGGQRMDLAADMTKVAVSPNLTPDPATSPIGKWSENVFVARFRVGEVVGGTPMPWGAFSRMTEDDLRSLYRYLRSLPAVSNETGPAMQDK